MLDALLNIFSGGITGVAGAALSGWIEHRKAAAAHEHELAVRRMNLEEIRLEAETAEKRGALELERTVEAGAAAALEASYRLEPKRYGRGDHVALVWVDVVRGLVRPVLTIGLVAASVAIYYHADATLRAETAGTLLYITTACTLWWFGGRVRAPKG